MEEVSSTIARGGGASASVIAPVRPTWKERVPARPRRSAILEWRRDRRLAHRPVAPQSTSGSGGEDRPQPATRSMVIRGGRSSEWEEWTELAISDRRRVRVPAVSRQLALPVEDGIEPRQRRAQRGPAWVRPSARILRRVSSYARRVVRQLLPRVRDRRQRLRLHRRLKRRASSRAESERRCVPPGEGRYDPSAYVAVRPSAA